MNAMLGFTLDIPVISATLIDRGETMRTALALLMLLAVPAASLAGDVAELEILGFSDDGSVFAFEEYGAFDGSGFPYSNRYYIDVDSDEFLPATPIRVRLDDENATIDEARRLSRERGEKIVGQSALAANPGFTAGSNAVTELSADPNRMLVNPRPIFYPVDEPLEFRLERVPLNGTERCQSHGEVNGFRLLRIDASEGGRTQVLHEDKSIPQSRDCPYGYGIGAVQTFYHDGGLSAYAVIISVSGYGFEGPNFRWLAVTGRW
jgi:predicted secreted protein